MTKIVTGINIQYPISRAILTGEKTIETRTYPIPEHYVGQELALVETPGSNGKFKARIVATIKFGRSFQYKTKEDFYKDMARHAVSPDSKWAWDDSKGKWGWPILEIILISSPQNLSKRSGIKFTKGLKVKMPF